MIERPSFSIGNPDLDKGLNNNLRLQVNNGDFEHEVRQTAHPLGHVAILGDCFVSPSALCNYTERAFNDGNIKALTELPGNYTTIVHEPDKTTVYNSIAGGQPIYYSESHEGVVVASQPTVANRNQSLSPNTEYLTAHLIMSDIAGGGLLGNATSYKGVSKLRGGEAITCTSEGSQLHTYDRLLPNADTTLQEAAEALRAALIDSLIARLDTGLTLGADLSGGVDSSSLVFLINRLSNRELPVFFAGDAQVDEGDFKYAKKFADLNQQLALRKTTINTGSFSLDELLNAYNGGELEGTQTPYGLQFMRAHFGAILGAGIDLHITGHGGDEVCKVNPSYLSDVLRNHRVRQFFREGSAWARLYNVSPFSLYKEFASLAIKPELSLQRAARSLEEYASTSDVQSMRSLFGLWQPIGSGVAWLTRQTRQEFAALLRAKAEQDIVPEDMNIGDYLAMEAMRAGGGGHEVLKHTLAQEGIPVSIQAPFLDSNVVRAAFSLPARKRGSPYEFKRILDAALQSLVPNEVLVRRTKGFYDEVIVNWMNASAPALRALMQDAYLADLGIIEPSPIRSLLNRIESASLSDIWSLERVIQAEIWLRGLANTTHPTTPHSAPRERVKVTKSETTPTPAAVSDEAPLVTDLVLPEHVYAVISEHGSIICFNRDTDSYYPLDKTQSKIFRLLVETGSLAQAACRLAEEYPAVDPALLQTDIKRCFDRLTAYGLLSRGSISRPLPAHRAPDLVINEFSTTRGKTDTLRVKFSDRVITSAALLSGILLDRLFKGGAKYRTLKYLQEKWCKQDAARDEARRLLQATQTTPFLGRIACMEAAYATALAASLKRQKITYHQGASFSPRAFHAWIVAEGEPVLSELDGHVMGSFQSFFAL